MPYAFIRHCFLALLLWLPLQADSQSLPELAARYDVIAKGVTVAEYRLRLRRPTPDRFEAEAELKPKGLLALFNRTTVRESSIGALRDGQTLPERYARETIGSKDDRIDVTEFLWDQGKVRMRFRNRDSEQPLPQGGLDPIGFYLALMSDAAHGGVRTTYTLAHRGRVKTYTLTDEGEATIDTGLGPLRIRKLAQRRPGHDRYTVFGLAPKLGYAPVMIERYQGGALDARIVIRARD